MIQQPNSRIINTQSGQSDIIKLRKLFLMVINNWYWFVLTLSIAGTGAFFINKYMLPTYRVTASILIEGGDNNAAPGLDNSMLEGFGLQSGAQNLDNQLIILSSWPLIRETLDALPYDTDCYRKGLFKQVSCYPEVPITLVPGANGAPRNMEFCFEHYKGFIYHLTQKGDARFELDTFMAYGMELVLPTGSFTIEQHPEFKKLYRPNEKLYFAFYDREALEDSYQRRLIVNTASKESTIIMLSLEGTNKTKDTDFLNKLLEVYTDNNLGKKNYEARRIIEFINDQLVVVSASLKQTENELQEFRSNNRIMDISAQAQQIIDQALVYENERARLTLESNYYDYLDAYLAKETNKEVPISPSTMGIEDPLLGNLMHDLAELQADYFSSGVGERNPLQSQLELKIKNTKQSIRETLHGIRLANKMAMADNKRQIRKLDTLASQLPEKERQLLSIQRKFNLNNELYTFLLQKRAEAQIQKASNRPDNELISPARASRSPIKPNKKMIYYYAFTLGLIIPLLVLFFGNVVNTKISSVEDIQSLTSLPVTGHIPHSKMSHNIIVLKEPASNVAEAFRSLRSRMEFFTKDVRNPVILLTSTVSGEGKTFDAVNLASAYSLTGKRTILIGFDLRRPSLSAIFGMNSAEGLSAYLIGRSNLDDIIYETEYPNFYLIPSGAIPPNPAELANSDKTQELVEKLKEQFDYIIIDSPPIGTISDNYTVASLADVTLIVVRHAKTQKSHLIATLTEVETIGVKGLSLLINDIKMKSSSYRYTYNY